MFAIVSMMRLTEVEISNKPKCAKQNSNFENFENTVNLIYTLWAMLEMMIWTTFTIATIPDKIVDTSHLPPIQCWSTLSSGRNSLVGLLIAEPTLHRGEGGDKKIVSGSSGGNTMCMTDDISKNGQN